MNGYHHDKAMAATESTSLLPRHHLEEPGKDRPHGSDYDRKIGFLGSLAIAVNSLAGPAILQLPFQYQESGLVPTTVCLGLVAVLAALCSLHMANVVSCIPGNRYFTKCVEFSDAFGTFLGPRCYKLTQALFFLTAVCLNTAAMVDTALVVDSVLGLHSPTGSLALDVGALLRRRDPDAHPVVAWSHAYPCSRRQVKEEACDPFNDSDTSGLLLTAGYVVTAAVFLPVSLMDLKENAAWQIGGFVLTVVLCLYFCLQFALVSWQQVQHVEAEFRQAAANHTAMVLEYEPQDLDASADGAPPYLHLPHRLSIISILTHNVSTWGSVYSNMLGVILFNFTLVLAIPAWLHERRPQVSVHGVVGGATLLSCLLYIGVGSLAAMAIPHANVNMLAPMVAGAFGDTMALAGSLFSFFIIGLDIPLFSVLTRYNLTHSGLCSERAANLLVVWIPWSVAWMLYQGDAVAQLLDWGGTILTSAVAFLLPLYLALRVLVHTDREGSLQVYGARLWTSRPAQVRAIRALFYATVAAVAAAIGGELAAAGDLAQYLRSDPYLNGTAAPYDWSVLFTDLFLR